MTTELDVHKNNSTRESFKKFIKDCETSAKIAIEVSKDKELKKIIGNRKPTFKVMVSNLPPTTEIIPNTPWKYAGEIKIGQITRFFIEIDAQLFLDNIEIYKHI